MAQAKKTSGTQAIVAAERAGIAFKVFEYEHEPGAESYGLEAALALRVEPEAVFKTLIASVDETKLVVAIVPVMERLNLKQLAAAAGGLDVADRASVAGALDRVDLLLATAGPADREAARDEEVAAVAVLDLDDVAGGPEAVDLVGEDELHGVLLPQRAVDV